jgi:hypothetical protein
MKENIEIQEYGDYLTEIKEQDKKDMKELDKELELLASEINNKSLFDTYNDVCSRYFLRNKLCPITEVYWSSCFHGAIQSPIYHLHFCLPSNLYHRED